MPGTGDPRSSHQEGSGHQNIEPGVPTTVDEQGGNVSEFEETEFDV